MAAPAVHVAPIRAFDPEEISVTGWFQLFNGYCHLVRIPEEAPNVHGVIPENERRRLFLQSLGLRVFEYLRVTCLPNTPYHFPIHALVRLLREKFEPPGLISTNRFQFRRRVQQQNESAADFITALQVLADRCAFGLQYPEELREQLIVGVRSNELRLELLKENNLTFFQAKEIATRNDALRNEVRLMAQSHLGAHAVNPQPQPQQNVPFKKNNKKFTKPSSPPQVNNNPKKKPPQPDNVSWNPCFRCTRRHDGRTCPAKNWECHKCKRKGHISKCCPSQQRRVHTATVPPPVVPTPNSQPTLEEEVERLFKVSKV